jgi:hypothetical protein
LTGETVGTVNGGGGDGLGFHGCLNSCS